MRLTAARRSRLAVLIVSTTVMIAPLSGCGGSSGVHTQTPTSDVVSPTTGTSAASSSESGASSASAPSSTNPADVAKQEALAFLPKYYATLDTLSSSGTLSLNGLDAVTTDNEATVEKTAIAEHRASGWVQQGSTQVETTTVTAVDLAPTGFTRPTVQITTCINVTNVREVDSTGKSVTVSTRPDFFVANLTLVNLNYPSATGWRVSNAPNKGATSCAGG